MGAELDALSNAAFYCGGDIPHASAAGTPDVYATLARGSFTPPKLAAVASAPAQPAPRFTIADLRLPAEVVRGRADTLAHTARQHGAPHSLRLWRVAFEQAVIALAREATHTAPSATCEALFWQQSGDDYCVSITFGQAPHPLLH